MEAGMGVRHLRAKEHHGFSITRCQEKAQKKPPLRAPEAHGPASTSVLGFQPPEPRQYNSVGLGHPITALCSDSQGSGSGTEMLGWGGHVIKMITPRTPFPEAQGPSYSGLHLAMPHGVIKLFKKNLTSLTPTFPFPLEFPLQILQKTKQ